MPYFEPLPTLIHGVFEFNIPLLNDSRGSFSKLYHELIEEIEAFNNFKMKELYYSFSNQGVIRGMHFQTPPAQHAKIVTCPQGKIQDVVLDVRKNSPTYGNYITIELSEHSGKALYIPEGCAHGFQSLAPNSMTLYLVSSIHDSTRDEGIHYDSFGMKWPLPITQISDRDASFPLLEEWNTPF